MKKKIEVIIDTKSKKEIDKLVKKNNRLSKAYDKSIEVLRKNPEAGQPVTKDQWPKKLKREYSLTNLYRYDIIRSHPGWRLIYTITPEGKVKILVVVLKVLDHHKYGRLFGYK